MFTLPFWQLISISFFSQFSHLPFFADHAYNGDRIANVSPNFTKLVRSLSTWKTSSFWAAAFCLCLQSFSPFDSLWTYLFKFFSSDNRSLCHDSVGLFSIEITVMKKNQPSQFRKTHQCYGVYLSTRPFLHHLLNIWEIWWQPLWRRSFPWF